MSLKEIFNHKILHCFEPENAHEIAKILAPLAGQLLPLREKSLSPFLSQTLDGINLASPVGLAGGFDKNADFPESIWKSLGFGWIEIGSITARPSQGQSKPRIFRLPDDRGIINRMGLPNKGAEAIAIKLAKQKRQFPFGINLAKTPDFAQKTPLSTIDDFALSYEKLGHEGSYTALNLSCPNSKDHRSVEHPEVFKELITTISQIKRKNKFCNPLWIKISPDSPQDLLAQTLEIAVTAGVTGIIVGNTTLQRKHVTQNANQLTAIGAGGLSGRPLLTIANHQLKVVTEIISQLKAPLAVIATGGISKPEDVIEKLALGADAVQVYTGFIYEGLSFVNRINDKILSLMNEQNITSIQDLKLSLRKK